MDNLTRKELVSLMDEISSSGGYIDVTAFRTAMDSANYAQARLLLLKASIAALLGWNSAGLERFYTRLNVSAEEAQELEQQAAPSHIKVSSEYIGTVTWQLPGIMRSALCKLDQNRQRQVCDEIKTVLTNAFKYLSFIATSRQSEIHLDDMHTSMSRALEPIFKRVQLEANEVLENLKKHQARKH